MRSYKLSMRRAKRRNRNTHRRIGRKRGGNLKDITMYILCWKSPRTIKNTLESYKKRNLIKHLNVVMYFQERDDKSDALAAEYGIPTVMGTNDNIGILHAFIHMIKATTTPYFILSECDFELVEDEKSVSDVLSDAMKLIRGKNVKLVKLRHRKYPGDPLTSMFGKSKDHKFEENYRYKLETLHLLDSPEKAFPNSFTIVDKPEYNRRWYICNFNDNAWSNNVFIADTKWMKDVIVPVLETNLKTLGGNVDFNKLHGAESILTTSILNEYLLAAGDGLFTHNRLNR